MEGRFYQTSGILNGKPIFIVDENGKYLGIYGNERFMDLLREGPHSLDEHPIIKTPPLNLRDPVKNFLSILAEPPFAVAVIDDNNQLLGAVTREAVFSMLGRARA
jgi:Mg/Co/Ni transporter MgtE